MQLAEKSVCTGCAACANICHRAAIKMTADEEGFLFPCVDATKCIGCGKCRDVCPVLSPGRFTPANVPVHAYCGCTEDDEIWAASTSGGLFSELCFLYTNERPIVFGAAFAPGFIVRHEWVDDVASIGKFRKSKYLQSEIGKAYLECQRFLGEGRVVLFSGTPCQIAGLKYFLGQEYHRLLTIEVICHGICSPKLFRGYLEYLESLSGKKIAEYEFRSKSSDAHVSNYCSRIHYADGSSRILQMDVYNRLFIDRLIHRQSCGTNCLFKQKKRYADVTLADARKEFELYPWKGKKNWSIIIANTLTGQKVVDLLRSKIKLYDYPSEYLVKTNPSYFRASPSNPKRKELFAQFVSLKNKDFWSCAKEFLPKPRSLLSRICIRLLRSVRRA